MSVLLRILATRPVFEIDPLVGFSLLSMAQQVMQGKVSFSEQAFDIQENALRVETVFAENKAQQQITTNHVAVLPIHGVMMAEDTACGPIGMISMAHLIREAANDPNISGIMLDIMSPGGSAYGNPELANAVAYVYSVTGEENHIDFFENGLKKYSSYTKYLMLYHYGSYLSNQTELSGRFGWPP